MAWCWRFSVTGGRTDWFLGSFTLVGKWRQAEWERYSIVLASAAGVRSAMPPIQGHTSRPQALKLCFREQHSQDNRFWTCEASQQGHDKRDPRQPGNVLSEILKFELLRHCMLFAGWCVVGYFELYPPGTSSGRSRWPCEGKLNVFFMSAIIVGSF